MWKCYPRNYWLQTWNRGWIENKFLGTLWACYDDPNHRPLLLTCFNNDDNDNDEEEEEEEEEKKKKKKKDHNLIEERKGARQKVEKNHSDHDNHMKKRRGAIKVL